MVIDFHTHIYPDAIAARALSVLCESVDNVTAYTDGTLSGLLSSMKRAGVDKSVILPVVTRKGQFETVNRFALEINKKYSELVSFAAIHPDDDDIEEKIFSLKRSGFKGVKLHPDYTGVFIDDERYIRIISLCAAAGLKVITHSGEDPAFELAHCPPEKGRAVLDRVRQSTGIDEPFMVFAHLGGLCMHKEVEKHLVGRSCYIDISCSFSSVKRYSDTDDEDVVRIIKNHGAERILFATDSPWNDQKAYVEHFKALKALSDKEKDLILFENAARLLS